MILVTTVWHTGTHSLVDMLGVPTKELKWLHCCDEALKLAKSGNCDRVVTTFREPADTALSWAKRKFPFRSRQWREQWAAYSKIVPYAEVYPVDTLDQRLNSDLRVPSCAPPKEDIDFAESCIKALPLRLSAG